MRKKNNWLLCYLIPCLAMVISLAAGIWRFTTFEARMRSRVERELPLGSSRSQVESWLETNRIEYGAIVNNHYAHEKKNYKSATVYDATLRSYSWIACRTDTFLTLTFKQDKLINAEISEGSVCL